MKYLKLFENFLQESKEDKKVFIMITSANSGNVIDLESFMSGSNNPPTSVLNNWEIAKSKAEQRWSINLDYVVDLTDFIDDINDMINSIRNRENRERLQSFFSQLNNEEFTKIIAGMIDKVKFHQDYNKFSDKFLENFGVTKSNSILKKIERMLRGVDPDPEKQKAAIDFYREKKTDFSFLNKFKALNIEQKLRFWKEIQKEQNFLILRSYIYAVVDESKMYDAIDRLLLKFEDLQ